MAAQSVSSDFGARSFAGGAVAAEGTATVELEYARGDRVRGNVTGGEGYAGRHRGRLAFFLIETTGVARDQEFGEPEEPFLVRRFDAGGTLTGAAAGGGDPAPALPPRTLRRHRGLRVDAVATRQFVPSALRLDRTEVAVCVEAHHPGGGVTTGPCAGDGPARSGFRLLPRRGCGRVGTIVHGFATPETVAVELTLGSGRRIRRATFDVSELGTPARAVAAVAPVGEAVRSVRGVDANGRTVHREPVGAAPSLRSCDGGMWSGLYAFGFDDGPVATSGPEQLVAGSAPGPRLLARDDGEHLCWGIDSSTGRDARCSVPPPEDDHLWPLVRRTGAHTAAAGLVPVGAAAVRIVFDGRETVTAAISDGGEYAGPYRGHVRFFLASASGRRRVTELQTLDAAGNLLTVTPGDDAFAGTPRTFARRGGLRIFAARYSVRFKSEGQRLQTDTGTCFGVAAGRRRVSRQACMPLAGSFRTGFVSCSPRVGVLMGKATRRAPDATLQLAGGGAIRSRAIRVPKRLGGGRLWLLRIPAHARGLRLRVGRQTSDYPIAAPRRQCGYTLEPAF